MEIDSNLTDECVLVELGSRICQFRLSKNWTQSEVALQAGVGLKTVQRLESGQAGAQLTSLVRILRVLGLLDRLNLIVTAAVASPVAQLKQVSKRRRRASSNKRESRSSSGGSLNGVSENKSNWTWGE